MHHVGDLLGQNITRISTVPTTSQHMEYSTIDHDLTREDYVALAEHQSSTPASFSLEDNVVCYFEGTVNVQLLSEDGKGDQTAYQQGKIYVLTSHVTLWFAQTSSGVNIPYQKILLHATQQGSDGHQQIYLQLEDSPLSLVGPFAGESQESFSEVIISTQPDTLIDTLFASLSTCAALHPDPSDSDNDMGQLQPALETHAEEMEPDGDLGEEGVGGWIAHEKIQTDSMDNASLEVILENEVRAGIVRPREGSEELAEKWRKVE
ncbi:regulator of volume decrease after cellular swelling-domain-containing protein [Yarrowia lipolytica]|jgi:hypothetical protein|uniref:Protein LOT5 n=2 Tax=Yarrowia lipolytica TaxID=4952 RepID=Q6C5D1_YARLI|nr:YALI0E19052p [Yarrowia lipolytica CLIB122]AOW05638.1 hypothetical protein YALI1_E22859g [Yarrowia lipolytica]KAB8281571.1 regulator of volume decrease after cellular swelling-domain-containing protein [Yarrowia lipolytica]KAE8171079.1 regulator of volume decrease after cellular swelling-domain-containing protein [Yarrowia lipolytica]KAJ8057107.1 regulator of volume decrease after cellular swelling-domain-containing protein [Yarrowia lipolytica]RDW23210.1 regulator of volume decrease after c|eukprot:XP_504131.1 YALI0E19052p [Yarrowia lipolytica CLIB122]